ncbi:MAG: hypothetical protein A2Z21_10050 [Candidatus Fraserbacteria bacterium RBG_16_55_9]|uniref:Uncharacterized protein n=1 Tax=Fraserbacteria sp. (strain RBG_16_55_9) TaxID=1817864 RepID=A0A1F5UNC1_FRAXR|nr:MAG: hypothetical protein A2Z21_10050 [Candidatus Fraserbacteria bacterium RBG_16_55_9]
MVILSTSPGSLGVSERAVRFSHDCSQRREETLHSDSYSLIVESWEHDLQCKAALDYLDPPA